MNISIINKKIYNYTRYNPKIDYLSFAYILICLPLNNQKINLVLMFNYKKKLLKVSEKLIFST
jgi:hypothetical protein